MRNSFRESIKSLEADIHHANTLVSGYRRDGDGASFQMRLSYSPSAQLFLFFVQWTNCQLAGALGLVNIIIYTTCTDGKTTVFVYKKKASIRQFYGVIFPSLLQLQRGITELEDRKQKEVCDKKYRRQNPPKRGEFMKLEEELEKECGICMEIHSKVILPNCCHSLCLKCYHDWSSRSESCPFCRDSLAQVKPCDLWIYTNEHDVVDLSVILMENANTLFNYVDKLPLIDPYPMSFNEHIG